MMCATCWHAHISEVPRSKSSLYIKLICSDTFCSQESNFLFDKEIIKFPLFVMKGNECLVSWLGDHCNEEWEPRYTNYYKYWGFLYFWEREREKSIDVRASVFSGPLSGIKPENWAGQVPLPGIEPATFCAQDNSHTWPGPDILDLCSCEM